MVTENSIATLCCSNKTSEIVWNTWRTTPAMVNSHEFHIWFQGFTDVRFFNFFVAKNGPWKKHRWNMMESEGHAKPPGFVSNLHRTYPLVNIQKAIENGHWNSGLSHSKHGDFPVRYVKLPDGINIHQHPSTSINIHQHPIDQWFCRT